jgi:hypothetical protein
MNDNQFLRMQSFYLRIFESYDFGVRHSRYTPQSAIFDLHSTCHVNRDTQCSGVGGMCTDPQIHTLAGKCFGDGNLGAVGYALLLKNHSMKNSDIFVIQYACIFAASQVQLGLQCLETHSS